MQLTPALPSTSVKAQTPQSVYCKFLFSREQFSFRHIRVPDISERLSAIAHEEKYYSLFKTVLSAEDGLKFAIKASIKGNEVAITQAGERYILWVHEADAVLAPPDHETITNRIADRLTDQVVDRIPDRLTDRIVDRIADRISINYSRILVPETFSSAPCRIFTHPNVCQFCYFEVPGSPDRIPGFRYEDRCYGLVQREPNAIKALAAISERACRGIELAIVPIPKSYGIFALEASAV
jgi:hypothetical protein